MTDNGGGDLHPGFNAPASAPAAPAAPASPARTENPFDRPTPARPERTRGVSPARDQREQAPEPAERTIKLGESEYSEQQVRDALAAHAEHQVIQRSLPPTPDAYELRLPENWESPVNVSWEPNPDDPLYQLARQKAHAAGLTQAEFSEMYGIFAAAEIGKQQRLNAVREQNVKLLGSAAPARIDAVSTFLTAHAGADGKVLAEFIRRYPSAAVVRAIETLQHAFSGQNAAGYRQDGRSAPEPPPLPSMSKGASYTTVRAAQDQALGQQVRLEGKRK